MSIASNDFIMIPEIAIEKIISTAVNFIRKDYKDNVEQHGDEKLSYLYYLTSLVFVERVDVFKEAKKIFLIEDEKDPKKININLGFPQTIKGAVNITITHSGEQYGTNALGVDQSPYIYEEFVNDTEVSDHWRNDFGRRYNSTYQIIITGDNTNETLITYNILKAAIISFEGTAHLSSLGFDNVRITGQDMIIKTDVTKKKYAKNITLNFEYEFRVPDVNRLTYWNNLIFKGLAKESIDGE